MSAYDLALSLQEKITEHVTDVLPFSDDEYASIRNSLLKLSELKPLIPNYLIKNRTVRQLNSFFRSSFQHYQQRRDFIQESFADLLNHLEFDSDHLHHSHSQNIIFISYAAKDKAVAGRLKKVLDSFGLPSFLAHEDIEVSDIWQTKILEEIVTCKIFICLLSKNFVESHFCLQETGIAASRKNVNIIPLSLDGQIPTGFIQKFQSTKINPDLPAIGDVMPALLLNSRNIGIDLALKLLLKIRGYRAAEELCALLMPYFRFLNKDQIKKLILACKTNEQVYDARQCASNFLPLLMKEFANEIDEDTKNFFVSQIIRYS